MPFRASIRKSRILASALMRSAVALRSSRPRAMAVMPNSEEHDEGDEGEPAAAGRQQREEDDDERQVDENQPGRADLELRHRSDRLEPLDPARGRHGVDQIGWRRRDARGSLGVGLPGHLHGAPGDDVAARNAQHHFHDEGAGRAQHQQRERGSGRMRDDAVVDLQDGKREREAEQIDDDRGGEHVRRQARQRLGQQLEEAPGIARDRERRRDALRPAVHRPSAVTHGARYPT